MRRPLSLRQVEAFKAVVEHGTVSRAAAALFVSPPALSKMIASFESDADLALFERSKGRLTPTRQGMRLYDEIDRVFSGVQQIETAVDAIRRESSGRIAIGAMPALSGPFLQRVTGGFLKRHPQVFCEMESRSSPRLIDWLVTRKLDVALVEAGPGSPQLVCTTIMEHPLVCIMPVGHTLAAKKLVRPADLADIPFVSFRPDSSAGQRFAAIFHEQRTPPRVVLVASMASTLCSFVAAGHGVSLVHPALIKEFAGRLESRKFIPAIYHGYQVCRNKESHNTVLVKDFIEELLHEAN